MMREERFAKKDGDNQGKAKDADPPAESLEFMGCIQCFLSLEQSS
jgi:hypothetical protein